MHVHKWASAPTSSLTHTKCLWWSPLLSPSRCCLLLLRVASYRNELMCSRLTWCQPLSWVHSSSHAQRSSLLGSAKGYTQHWKARSLSSICKSQAPYCGNGRSHCPSEPLSSSSECLDLISFWRGSSIRHLHTELSRTNPRSIAYRPHSPGRLLPWSWWSSSESSLEAPCSTTPLLCSRKALAAPSTLREFFELEAASSQDLYIWSGAISLPRRIRFSPLAPSSKRVFSCLATSYCSLGSPALPVLPIALWVNPIPKTFLLFLTVEAI